jgi:Amt family ammonium transporter
MTGAIAGLSLIPISTIRKHTWLITFVLAGLLVTASGIIAVQSAFGQFGEFADLPKAEDVDEFHCSVATHKPGSSWYGTCIDPGDTTFMYIAAIIVMIMTPGGVGFLYGGLTRRKNALTVILQNFLVYCIVSIQWVIWGYSLTFGPDTGSHFIGTFDYALLNNVAHDAPADVYATSIPHIGWVMFQLMFAAITPALAIAGYADRVKMSAFLIFTVLWATFIYDFVGHWNWSLGSNCPSDTNFDCAGWLGALGALDFAGGTVIHITSGFSGLASAMFLGRRLGYGKAPFEPHSIPLVMLGATLLWFGWFGFNPGSAGFAGFLETEAFQNTNVATAVAAMWWMFLSWAHTGRTSAVGAASGAVAGLVAITPASGFIGIWGSIIVGFLAATVCFYCLIIKNRGRIDDALDTWPVHGMGGVVGALLTGVFAEKRINPLWGDDGLFFGNPAQFLENAIGAAAGAAWAFGLTLLIWKIMDAIWPGGVRVTPREEEIGLDITQVGEKAYSE